MATAGWEGSADGDGESDGEESDESEEGEDFGGVGTGSGRTRAGGHAGLGMGVSAIRSLSDEAHSEIDEAVAAAEAKCRDLEIQLFFAEGMDQQRITNGSLTDH